MKCMIVTYALGFVHSSEEETSKGVFKAVKESVLPEVHLIWDEDIYIVNIGNGEHLKFKEEMNKLRIEFFKTTINELSLIIYEGKILDMLENFKRKDCVKNYDTFRTWVKIFPQQGYAMIEKNPCFEVFEKLGRM